MTSRVVLYLSFRRHSDEFFAVRGESDDRWSRSRSLGILNNARRLSFHDGDARICRSQIDSDYDSLYAAIRAGDREPRVFAFGETIAASSHLFQRRAKRDSAAKRRVVGARVQVYDP